MRTRHFALLCAAALIAGCGGSNSKDAAKPGTAPSEKLRRELDAATKTSPKAFPAAEGRTLQEVADDLGASGPQVGLASSVFVPGRNRLAFGVIDRQTGFVSVPPRSTWRADPITPRGDRSRPQPIC